jgi:hypothetical protein
VTTQFKVRCWTATQSGDFWNYVFSITPGGENKAYWDATPVFSMYTTIKGEQRYFQGKDYILDSTPVDG